MSSTSSPWVHNDILCPATGKSTEHSGGQRPFRFSLLLALSHSFLLRLLQIPLNFPIQLHTSSFRAIIPQLARLYPNMELEFETSPQSAPFLMFTPGNVTLVPVMDIQAFALLPNSSGRKPLFQLRAVSLNLARAIKGHVCHGWKPLAQLKDWETTQLIDSGGYLFLERGEWVLRSWSEQPAFLRPQPLGHQLGFRVELFSVAATGIHSSVAGKISPPGKRKWTQVEQLTIIDGTGFTGPPNPITWFNPTPVTGQASSLNTDRTNISITINVNSSRIVGSLTTGRLMFPEWGVRCSSLGFVFIHVLLDSFALAPPLLQMNLMESIHNYYALHIIYPSLDGKNSCY
ncbi:hypothetical protein J1605_015821 [Eschrichtius robustus]|uniref:Bactericidal permeability-increasing protein n=1 Tax=Eschrichtius robustus TaxID=9764 RepID=A0AB34GB80_ESCRO|nr:hypothetical protein J1605_015821 [Eschrichtius robustus]